MSLEKTCTDILDAWILVDNRVVTCKLLSRLMRIRVDAAAGLMAQWHNSQKGSHATFVLCGSNPVRNRDLSSTSTNVSAILSDSSHASIEPRVCSSKKEQVIHLVPQEQLDQVKKQYDTVLGCHIYSLEPGRLTDSSMLTSCNVDIQEAMAGQSNKIADLSQTYGIIFNAEVHELDNNPKALRNPVPQVKPIIKPQLSRDQSSSNAIPRPSPTTAQDASVEKRSDTPVTGGLVMKRSASSSLASAFAKTPKPKVKPIPEDNTEKHASTEVKSETTGTATSATIEKLPVISNLEQDSTKAELEAMMMEEDEIVPTKMNADHGTVQTIDKIDEDLLEAEEWSASDTEMKESKPLKVVAASAVRPRGRKKVKKQVHTKDAKGYMVTREEWEWISCDEDEVPIPSLARQSSTASSKNKAPLKKKSAGGGIASYFTKK